MRNKLDPKPRKCIILGYQHGKGYRFWDPIAEKLPTSKDVSFNEPKSLDAGIRIDLTDKLCSLQPHKTERIEYIESKLTRL